MNATYRAMQITAPGQLDLVERITPRPGAGEVLIAVEACGICGADAADLRRIDAGLAQPRVPGHEVVGRIAALGERVSPRWRLGQRVGVGRLGGHCGDCRHCRQGDFQLCLDQPVVGVTQDGGYAEAMLARASGLVATPDALNAEQAAPILCAGLATFNALKKCGAQAGDTVAVVGIGGLGHMALQYARRMGFRVVAVGRGSDIAEDALALGAHVYVDTQREDAAQVLNGLGGAMALIATANSPAAIATVLDGLSPGGCLVVLGTGQDPLPVSPSFLVRGERSVLGSMTGSPHDNERTLDFSVLTGVRPMIETFPLDQANAGHRRLQAGDVRFRMVLTMG